MGDTKELSVLGSDLEWLFLSAQKFYSFQLFFGRISIIVGIHMKMMGVVELVRNMERLS